MLKSYTFRIHVCANYRSVEHRTSNPAMEITDHLKAGYTALHTVMLEIKMKSSAHFYDNL